MQCRNIEFIDIFINDQSVSLAVVFLLCHCLPRDLLTDLEISIESTENIR